ncbi:MAG TPA: hypothetical protein VM779_13855 [Thermoanaerobaculia bacterium]|nr:hypothetical protein [Thermoanaerobaculia bacterium]
MRFAIVTRDELWESGGLREERLSYGEAIARDGAIAATDALDSELLRAVDGAISLTRPFATLRATLTPLRRGEGLRIVVSARRAGDSIITEAVVVVSAMELSVVTSPGHLEADLEWIRSIAAERPALSIDDHRNLPIVWRHGSGAVLLHEAAGHPAEHRKERVEWPGWLTVTDEPPFDTDDTGRPARAVDLLGGGEPSAKRRASFRDVPLTRLSNVVVRQSGAPFDLPSHRIDVLLVGGGAYDPLTDAVTIRVVASDLIEGERSQRLAPFTITESRPSIARAVRGAGGEPQRYPGVICSTEGQEIAVGSHAPLLLTRF